MRPFLTLATAATLAFTTAPAATVATQTDQKFEQIVSLVTQKMDFIDSIRDLPQLAEPGEVWSYNNAGFNVAGRVIEVVSGQPIHIRNAKGEAGWVRLVGRIARKD